MKNKRKGFTLIELLAVIVILGLLMAIAIPSVTKYITESRKKTLTNTIENYMSALSNDVNDLTYTFTGYNIVYAVPIECIALERGGTNPFGAWHQANNAYWAYVLVQYDDTTSSYIYGFTFKDSAGYGLYPTSQSKLNEQGKQIRTNLELTRPKDGSLTALTNLDNWSGFNLRTSTRLVVLVAETEGNVGNGQTTCTLQQKGSNYDEVADENIANLEKNLLMKGSKATGADETFFGSNYKRSQIEAVYTINNQNVPANAIDSWDVSASKNGKVTAWLLNSDNDALYELYIGATGKIVANPDSSFLFQYFSNTTTIDLSNLDTSNVTTMNAMFSYCSSLINLNIKTFDTSKVTTMQAMFNNCKNLTNLDLSHFDTSNVISIKAMFQMCEKLTTLNISNFNTSKVSEMSYMFNYCTKLNSLDLSHFNTSQVTNMQSMFQKCENLSSINISSFDTSNVTDVSYMFTYCSKITNLDIRNFDFSKVTTYESMTYLIPTTTKFIVKDDTARNWIKTNINSSYTNIITVDEL